MLASLSKGDFTNLAKFIDPNRHAPYGGNGCSPQGLVADIFSQYDKLFRAFIRSINITPGSANSYVDRIILFQSSRAEIVLNILPLNTKSQALLLRTASINSSVIRTERLNIRRSTGSLLAPINSSMSG